MANNPESKQLNQRFPDTERLFRRLRWNNIGRNGKPTLFAFELPDMSVNRESMSTAADTRKGFEKSEWAVAAFVVADIPPRKEWAHIVQRYQLKPRHVPIPGNFSHSEVRVTRKIDDAWVLITLRQPAEFEIDDPDRDEQRGTPDQWLDPDFHLRWRKHIALASKVVLQPDPAPDGFST